MKPALIALDIGGTFLKSCLFDFSGKLIPGSFDSEPVDSDGALPEVKTSYQTLLRRFREAAEERGYAVSAVAADTPGPFDYPAGTSRMTHKYTAIKDVPLRPWFREILGDVPVAFLHDSSAFLYGAAAAHPEIRNAAGVMIGTGLGFAVMKDGKILKNESGGPAYSIFKMPYRGKTAEDFVSGRGILARYDALSGVEAGSAKGVSVRASGGDKTAISVFQETGEILAELIAPILKELGTEALYLGGQISKSFAFFEEPLKQGLSGLKMLQRIEASADMDLVHLTGVKEWFFTEHPEKELLKPYPMKLTAVCKDILWGGTRLGKEYHKTGGKIAEAWELTVHPEGVNRIENGANAGRILSEVVGQKEQFPLLIKLIDAADKLSIQVHPVKTEMWVILDAEPGAKLVYGLKEKFDEAEFRRALQEKTVENLLNFVPVHPGDVFFIPQGLVHAIGAGILIAEIQENSNVTYRVYDYSRLKDGKPRELHVDSAMKTVRDFTEAEIEALRFSLGKGEDSTIANCPLFRVDRITLDGERTLSVRAPFTSVVVTDGSGTIGGEPFGKGDSFYLPAELGKTVLSGRAELLVTTIPAGGKKN